MATHFYSERSGGILSLPTHGRIRPPAVQKKVPIIHISIASRSLDLGAHGYFSMPNSHRTGPYPGHVQGWRDRRPRESDARIVRVVNFEHALSHLTEEHQSILILTNREHRDQGQVSDATDVSVRALAYKLPRAPGASLDPRSPRPTVKDATVFRQDELTRPAPPGRNRRGSVLAGPAWARTEL